MNIGEPSEANGLSPANRYLQGKLGHLYNNVSGPKYYHRLLSTGTNCYMRTRYSFHFFCLPSFSKYPFGRLVCRLIMSAAKRLSEK